jgi:hypothetical protein
LFVFPAFLRSFPFPFSFLFFFSMPTALRLRLSISIAIESCEIPFMDHIYCGPMSTISGMKIMSLNADKAVEATGGERDGNYVMNKLLLPPLEDVFVAEICPATKDVPRRGFGLPQRLSSGGGRIGQLFATPSTAAL